eukprot:CAMPEP_0185000466 /NCGR_PEP_ID=MMETSP1098-20130426/68220_1 /TAXON_ID=89044 /ORGANISM="Spumella elongata, Strain CCAP 955/1" /LENGTH=65 /DNA_ID=CAMNT_0027527637 /DNA_START=51 /DNA_END=248 /DNA_ORIENTATION=+
MPHHPSQLKVFAGTMLILGFCAVTFYGPKQKADGHNLFDVSKPAAIQESMDIAEKERLKVNGPKK